MQDHDKRGRFYLGREHDLATRTTGTAKLLYDSNDLVTHAVCVGMTGSGKTGLCLSILEEAVLDGIPAIVIDPKGDLGNLLLTFPQLRAEDFRPWINPDDARKLGVSEDEFAAQQAALWKTGLAKWDEDGARISRLKAAADFTIYTPGSNAGIPISIIKSFDAPAAVIADDAELFAERIATTATSLLGLMGIDADPIRSREHILLSHLFSYAWSAGRDLDMAGLIQQIRQPPIEKVGVIDLESFFPQKERFALAMKLNNLLAAPGFAQWMSGVPLDVQSMLYTSDGKPRVAIVSIAHLGDAERMFVVSLLLNQVLGWMRQQGGTTSLRALLYMDEIFGYFPPSANPPSKQPLLTLLKQGRAFGLGVMLATQNPVDLDYKGLSNCGTWFIGRLQTERDKARLLEGLEGAAAGAKFDAAKMGQTLAALGNRVFLMNNVHEDAPTIFETRWCMSYLRGPLGKAEIKRLMDPVRARFVDGEAASGAEARGVSATTPANARPVLPPSIPQFFLPIRGAAVAGATLTYVPKLFGSADVYFNDKASDVSVTRPNALLADVSDGPVCVEWTTAQPIDIDESTLERAPDATATFAPLPAVITQPKQFEACAKAFADGLFRISTLALWKSESLDLVSKPDETEAAFRTRVAQSAGLQRDAESAALRKKYDPKFAMLNDRRLRAQQRVEREASQAKSAKWSAFLSFLTSLFGALLGGKRGISKTSINQAGTAARSAGRAMQQAGDVGQAEESVAAIDAKIAQQNDELKVQLDAIAAKYDPATLTLTKLSLRPKKTDIKPRVVALAWTPHWTDARGTQTPAYL